MTSANFGPVAAGYQAFKGMLFTPSNPDTLQLLITWLEHNQQYPMLLQEARNWLAEPMELECDYNRMCIGPTRLLVPPYESVYRDGGRQLNTDNTTAVASFYQKLGLVIDNKLNEPADYIGNEMEFLFCAEALCHHHSHTNPTVANELNQMAQRFLQQHLGTWFEDFTNGMSHHAQLKFWDCYAKALADFLAKRLNIAEAYASSEKPRLDA
ncbi:MAG: TorD/DmsD family molecular chaperone [Shewanella sp.]